MKVIEGLYYSKDHEWVKVDGQTAYIGITDYAQHCLGAIVFVELPEEGATLTEGEVLGVVESVKAASDVYAPVSGTVLSVNTALVDDPGALNTDAFENWMVQAELSDLSQLDTLMDATAYEAFTKKEG